MNSGLLYPLMPYKKKCGALLSFAAQDAFFEPIVHDLVDYGCAIKFSLFGGAGAYQPFALSTDHLDTPEKQQQFSHGFWTMSENGAFKANMSFALLTGRGGNAHSFLHEIMHFYQDLNGLYLVPLKERGVVPVMLSLKGYIKVVLFCEAWAQVEAIRTCRSLREKGDNSGWRGALNSRDWKELAIEYDADIKRGMDEAMAAAKVFHSWYKGSNHRNFYESHAADCYDLDFVRLTGDVKNLTHEDVAGNFRTLDLPRLIEKLPKDRTPEFFSHIDWHDALFNEAVNGEVIAKIKAFEDTYGVIDNDDIFEIKCGSPPYLWKRLRIAEIVASDVPPH